MTLRKGERRENRRLRNRYGMKVRGRSVMTLQREIGKKANRAARLIPDREKGETMHINEIVCQTCAGAGLPQRHSWSQTKRYGILVCGICQHQTDIRKHHALKKGRNKWFRKVTVLGKTALRCNIDGKWVLPNWTEARAEAHFHGKFAYRSPKCGEIHLASTPVRM